MKKWEEEGGPHRHTDTHTQTQYKDFLFIYFYSAYILKEFLFKKVEEEEEEGQLKKGRIFLFKGSDKFQSGSVIIRKLYFLVYYISS